MVVLEARRGVGVLNRAEEATPTYRGNNPTVHRQSLVLVRVRGGRRCERCALWQSCCRFIHISLCRVAAGGVPIDLPSFWKLDFWHLGHAHTRDWSGKSWPCLPFSLVATKAAGPAPARPNPLRLGVSTKHACVSLLVCLFCSSGSSIDLVHTPGSKTSYRRRKKPPPLSGPPWAYLPCPHTAAPAPPAMAANQVRGAQAQPAWGPGNDHCGAEEG